MKPISAKYPDLPAALLLLLATILLFWPASRWIAQQTLAHEQLRQSFFLLLFAAVVLGIDHGRSLVPVVEVSRRSVALLAGAFLLMAAGLVFPAPYFPLAALALALAAFVHVLFGERGLKMSLPWLAGFGAFLAFVFLFHRFDWPLRQMAGGHAAYLLGLLGNEVRLGAISDQGGMLLLSVNDRVYHVAPECNGFGLMSTSAVLALLLVVSRPLPLFWKGFAVVLALVVGFTFNLLRILGIVLAAPHLPDHYHLIHEAIGLAALFGGLAFLWWLIRGGSRQEEKVEAEVRLAIKE